MEDKNFVRNIRYIEWLEKFTEKYDNFSTIDWLHYPEKLSKQDKKNLARLGQLFIIIDDYCRENYITGNCEKYAFHYNIKHNNIGYIIGTLDAL